VTIITLWLTILAIHAPGQLSYDTIAQLHEARFRSYAGYHPPLMSFLMLVFDHILPGTALFLLFMQALFFGALMIAVRSAGRVGWWTPVIVVLGSLHPLVLVYQGIVWKDVLFANFAVFAFALLFAASRRHGWPRYALFALGLLAAACGGLIRQNGAVALVVLCIAILHLELRSSSFRAVAAAVLGGTIAAVLVLGLTWAVSTALIRASANKLPVNAFGIALMASFHYDISGILATSDRPETRPLSARGLDATAVREDARRYYSAERQDGLNDASRFNAEVRKLKLPQLAAAWSELVIGNFGAYLRHRLAVYRWMIWPPEALKCVPVHLGIDGPADLLNRLEMTASIRPSDRALYRYTLKFVHTPLYRHGFFLIVAIVTTIFLFLRHGPVVAIPAAGLLMAGILFTLSWAVFGVACDTRYAYFLPLAVFVAIIMLSLLEAERRASSSGAPRT
jgi:hypothetical protein